MKANIHPEVKDATVTCACGATFQTKSTKEKIDVEICRIFSIVIFIFKHYNNFDDKLQKKVLY